MHPFDAAASKAKATGFHPKNHIRSLKCCTMMMMAAAERPQKPPNRKRVYISNGVINSTEAVDSWSSADAFNQPMVQSHPTYRKWEIWRCRPLSIHSCRSSLLVTVNLSGRLVVPSIFKGPRRNTTCWRQRSFLHLLHYYVDFEYKS